MDRTDIAADLLKRPDAPVIEYRGTEAVNAFVDWLEAAAKRPYSLTRLRDAAAFKGVLSQPAQPGLYAAIRGRDWYVEPAELAG